MLPIEIQMQIDITAAAHQREIAGKFAALRKQLLPEPIRTHQDPWRAMTNAELARLLSHQQAALEPYPYPHLMSLNQLANAANDMGHGLASWWNGTYPLTSILSSQRSPTFAQQYPL
jgi:hypothetical protein